MKFKSLITIITIISLNFLFTGCATQDSNHLNTTNIAILMPLTGPDGAQGQRLASMIELGLEDGLQGNIKVITYDIAEEARMPYILNKIKARGTKLILGPIYSATVQNIIPQLENHNVTILSLSNNPAIVSDKVFIFGHSPMKQTQRILNYMISKGYKDFITLLPSNKYSNEVAVVAKNILEQSSGRLVASEFYNNQQESIESAVQNIVNIVQNINESEEAIMKPVLYISDDTSLLRDVVDAIKRNNLDIQTVIIGDDKLYAQYDQTFDFLMTGSYNLVQDDIMAKAHKLLNIVNITQLDIVAYDLGKITAHSLGQGLTHDQFIARLLSGQTFQGASGSIRMVDKIAERKYDILSHDSMGYHLLQPSN